MRKKMIISLMGIVVLLILGYYLYQKYSTPTLIHLPESSTISSIEITSKAETMQYKEIEEIDSIIQRLSNSELTRKTSVQDVPLVEDYTSIILNLVNGEPITLYVYQENENWFIELPYQGIYKINK